ncbi:hypothetical protein JTB14_029623 [Gonioctena quinquepunctata]|nr:hypothetical protein JTB14_029623 [Gonioctena quinquepunctata]
MRVFAYFLVLRLIYAINGATSDDRGQFCTEHSDRKHPQFSNPGHEVICTDLDMNLTTRFRLPDQCNEIFTKQTIQLISVKGALRKKSFALFPFAAVVLIYRSQIEVFDAAMKLGSALHIAESTFPTITPKLFKENHSFWKLGLHSNPNLTIEQDAFDQYVLLQELIIYNQTIPVLGTRFLRGIEFLKSIVLNRNNLSIIHEDAFEKNLGLRYINLDHNPLRHFDVRLLSLRWLETLSIADTEILKLNLKIFFPVKSLKSLVPPISVLKNMKEIDVLELCLAFPQLRNMTWNSNEENGTTWEPVRMKMENSGLIVKDVKKSILPTSTIYVDDLGNP